MSIHWYPGHMAKTRRELEQGLKAVDAVLCLLDCRLPYSSYNPELSKLSQRKPMLFVMAKADLADASVTSFWSEKFDALPLSLLENRERKKLLAHLREKLTVAARKRYIRPWRLMVVGIPNVGKSTLINLLAGRRSAQVGNRPGITRSQQWVNVGSDIQLLDTPGILWPRLSDREVALRLAAAGCIKDDVLPLEEVATWLLGFLAEWYSERLNQRYGCPRANLETVGRRMGLVLPGERVDTGKAAEILLKDFRSGKLGRITLDRQGVEL